MSRAVENALIKSQAALNTVRHRAASMQEKGTLMDAIGMGSSASSPFLGLGSGQGANKQRYGLFRGWVYSAVHALALEGAGQPVHVGRLHGSQTPQQRSSPMSSKAYLMSKMTETPQSKAASRELEFLVDHPLLTSLEVPNPIQYKWQFVYSFITNLSLTGWGYVIGSATEDGGFEYYSLPTTWVTPIHAKGAFSQFRIADPNVPLASDAPILDREHVAFAYIPNPGDPLQALAPAQAQMNAIKIDDSIQTSQRAFFDNGIFPSVVITMGKNPHPDVAGDSFRPRLSPAQRRQINSAIKKVSGGVSNYGNPAIVDGLIEKIDRLSATQNEMGWEKSEKNTRMRILSAFGVHPFILGEEMAGSYAQAAVVEKIFCKRVNTYLDLLGTLMTGFAAPMAETDNKLLVWYEACLAKDPALEQKLWVDARKNDDISQNEFRAYLGMPPDEDSNQSVINKSDTSSVTEIAKKVHLGELSPDQGVAVLEGRGVPTDLAVRIAGEAPPAPEEVDETEMLAASSEAIEEAVRMMGSPVQVEFDEKKIQDLVADSVKSLHESRKEDVATHDELYAKAFKQVAQLEDRINYEKMQREHNAELLEKTVENAVDSVSHESKTVLDALRLAIESGKSGDIRDILNSMDSNVTKALDSVDQAVKQPISVQVTNQVETPEVHVDVTNDVKTPEVIVTNEVGVPDVQVDVVNEVKTPEVSVTNVVDTPDVQVDVVNEVKTPDIKIDPQINIDVQPATVDLTLNREDAAKKAEITHPDGSISKIDLKE